MLDRPCLVAVLGPTNTGKTHFAIDRMLGFKTGIIGLPLRLLAREVYDKVAHLRGVNSVALITGEERIVPKEPRYWVCTVEAMPSDKAVDFLAIDEIQLCADPERGHVFTERLLNSRGLQETLFLGSDSMRSPLRELVPNAVFKRRERMSQLSYAGKTKLSRMPPRSAIVSFSVDKVYEIAEAVRCQKGGAAVVMGALSPRTRNAQVNLYQSGEVNFLVATDAIGMGLNLDIDHVAFAGLAKFDGRANRLLAPNELAQIAGRAGRGMANGTFGETDAVSPLEPKVVSAIENHQFTPIKRLNWRNPNLRFDSLAALVEALHQSPKHAKLVKAQAADDLKVLETLAADLNIRERVTDISSVRLLWDVCRVPDFRSISHSEHANLLRTLFDFLHDRGCLPEDWLARQVRLIDRTDGDIDTLSMRLASVRTWTYASQQRGWIAEEDFWREKTREIEDKLSDALHEQLTQRFVDRRTSVLLRSRERQDALVAEVNPIGEIVVEGERVGCLDGFRFVLEKGTSHAAAKSLKWASAQVLMPYYTLQSERLQKAADPEITLTHQGHLQWQGSTIGKIVAGPELLNPQLTVFVDDTAGPSIAEKVEKRLSQFVASTINRLLAPLVAMQQDYALDPLARGFAFRLVENLGIIARSSVDRELKDLEQSSRRSLRAHGVRFGQYSVFLPVLLKPAPTQLRLVLWSLSRGMQNCPLGPPAGAVTVLANKAAPAGYYAMAGFQTAGERAIRIDILERLMDLLRVENRTRGFEATEQMLSITGLTLLQFADLMRGLGYRVAQHERQKRNAIALEEDGHSAQVSQPNGVDAALANPAPASSVPSLGLGIETSSATAFSPTMSQPVAANSGNEVVEETETYYIFSWRYDRKQSRHKRSARSNSVPRDGLKSDSKKRRGTRKGKQTQGMSASVNRQKLDPHNPFVMALKDFQRKK